MASQFPFDAEYITGQPSFEEGNPLSYLQQVEGSPNLSAFQDFDEELPLEQPTEQPQDFYANLAESIPEEDLNRLASKLLDKIEDDKEARKEWEDTTNTVLKYLGWKIEEYRSEPFPHACGAYDTTLSQALLSSFAVAKATLFPQGGPANTKIFGVPTPETEDRAERVKLFLNYYLTQIDKNYYPDSELLLMYIIFYGSAFRKVYQDPILNRPASRTIKPYDLIVNPDTTDILSSTRITQVISLTKKEIMLKVLNGEFTEDAIPKDDTEDEDDLSSVQKTINRVSGINQEASESKSIFTFYECHTELDDEEIFYSSDENYEEDNSLPKPYIVTIFKDTKKIVSIRRNWREEDGLQSRVECFINYFFLRGFSIYGIGLAQLLGSNAITLSTILRQLLDAGTYKNFPGGMRVSGMKLINNDKMVPPGGFVEVDTGGLPIQQALMPMPYGEPSTVLATLLNELKEDSAKLAGTVEMQIPEVGSDAPVGTTLAALEVASRMQSTVLMSLHFSLGKELQLLSSLFGEYLSDEPYPFAVPGREVSIMRSDFSDMINVVPISDPNVLTSAHRLILSQATLSTAQGAPQLHNMKEVYRRYYEAMHVQDISAILPPDQQAAPLDPITENMNALNGMPLKASIEQDHSAHMIVHSNWEQQLAIMLTQQGIDVSAAKAVMAAHIREHASLNYLVQMQMMMGAQMPPQEAMMNPEIQNQIALQAAQAIMEQQRIEQKSQPQPLDPNAVMLADIEQRREAAYLKNDEAKMRTETEAFKSQLNFEANKEKIEAQKEMAEEKNEVDLTIANMKNST